ncbi:glycosyltransferase family 4 protein [Simkania negevensis]|uniref:Glycosyltransferase family 4 protein n=1 Tax=Simkania negevensis TaxID=83561 RepID=A0ABS3AS75_9BACT|nr:glycosyltransferase family 4 protein [Simkania negevensis]
MKILHTEASPGWGGQEMRILKEAMGMRTRGHDVIAAITKGGGLVSPMRQEGFTVYELPLNKRHQLFKNAIGLASIIRKHAIDIVNTHSSLDSWVGGIVARLMRKKVVRTRHLSTNIRKGFNSIVLYGKLADGVVTTCEDAAAMIRQQANLSHIRCHSVPTGINTNELNIDHDTIQSYRQQIGVSAQDCLIGTLCFLRTWKGVQDLLKAAQMVKGQRHIKWVVIGRGPSEGWLKSLAKELDVERQVVFFGHADIPALPLAALDVFALLSTGNEGVSQASLQAAYLQKPLITTPTGGLKEVCLDGITGCQVSINTPAAVADKAALLANNPQMRMDMGKKARQLVIEKFTIERTLDQMEAMYREVLGNGRSFTPSAR